MPKIVSRVMSKYKILSSFACAQTEVSSVLNAVCILVKSCKVKSLVCGVLAHQLIFPTKYRCYISIGATRHLSANKRS
jgi:hypothetical protein